MVTAVLLENQEKTLREEAEFLGEAGPTNSAGTGGFSGSAGNTVAGFDPVLISLIRRAILTNDMTYWCSTNEWSY